MYALAQIRMLRELQSSEESLKGRYRFPDEMEGFLRTHEWCMIRNKVASSFAILFVDRTNYKGTGTICNNPLLTQEITKSGKLQTLS